MRRHIVAAFRTVCEVVGILGHNPVEELFQIVARTRVGIFHDHNAATGVLNKRCHRAVSHSALTYLHLQIIRDFVESLSVRPKIKLCVMDMHR